MNLDPDLDDEAVIQHLIESVRCSECGGAYEAEDVYILSQENDTWALVAYCPTCGLESVVMAYVDATYSADMDPPDEDEVAAWGRFLAAFEGDLRDLLGTV